MLRIAWVYDLNACRNPTGVTRHALAQLDELSRRPNVDLTAVTGRISEPEGLACWNTLGRARRRGLPLSTHDCLRVWRILGRPNIERWTGDLDWVYSPAEFLVPSRSARKAVTSHDVLQSILYDPPRRRAHWRRVFHDADLILSVSRFNTERLIEHFPCAEGKVAQVPNGAEDLYFEPPTAEERHAVRELLGLPAGLPYLLSVANFQSRKNLVRLIRAVSRLPRVASGDLALALVGSGAPHETRILLSEIEELRSRRSKARIVLPGYLQGVPLRAAYAESTALVFPSLCESFGIPTVEAMAQGVPVALANTTALPEIGGAAGWYFDPMSEESINATLAELLDRDSERNARAEIGRSLARAFRWSAASDTLLSAMQGAAR